MKNDITYEYRVFTNRLIDVESMEVGICTSKVINELKSKDKVDGRFFHTSDTDEWFFCWNGELQKLNLKGDSDVSAALEEVEKLIADAKVAVEDAKKTAGEAKDAADAAKVAADSATAAVETIENKADKSEVASVNSIAAAAQTTANEAKDTATAAKSAADAAVESIENKADKEDVNKVETTANEAKELVNEVKVAVDSKADQSVVEELSAKVDAIPSMETVALKSDLDDYAKIEDIPVIPSLEDYALQSSVDALSDKVDAIVIPSLNGYATEEFVINKIAEAELNDKDVDLSGYATKEDIVNFVTKDEVPSVEGLASTTYVDEKVAAIKIPSIDNLATKEETEGIKTWVNEQGFLTEHQDITGKQDVIEDIEEIRSNAAIGATALQEVPEEYVTETELLNKGYLTEESLSGYATEEFVGSEIAKIVIPEIPSMEDVVKKEDLNDYALKTEIPSMDNVALKSDIPSLDDYALKTEIPSMDNYFTKEEINALIGEAVNITNTILA
jgi:hypothetical protein